MFAHINTFDCIKLGAVDLIIIAHRLLPLPDGAKAKRQVCVCVFECLSILESASLARHLYSIFPRRPCGGAQRWPR